MQQCLNKCSSLIFVLMYFLSCPSSISSCGIFPILANSLFFMSVSNRSALQFCSCICFCSFYFASILLLSLFHLSSFFAPLIWPFSYHLFSFSNSFAVCTLIFFTHVSIIFSFPHLFFPILCSSCSPSLNMFFSFFVFCCVFVCFFLHYLSFQLHLILCCLSYHCLFHSLTLFFSYVFHRILWSSYAVFSDFSSFHLCVVSGSLFPSASKPCLSFCSSSLFPLDILFWLFFISCSFLIVIIELFSLFMLFCLFALALSFVICNVFF